MQIDRPIAITITIFVIILLVFFLVAPEYQTFQNLQLDLGKKRAEFNAEHEYYSEIAKTYFELQGRSDDIKKIDDALPQSQDFGKDIYFLQQTATANGMMMKSLFLSKSTSGASSGSNNLGNINSIVFSVNLIGDYSSLESFMASIEKSSRLLEITNISFGSSSASQPGFSLGKQQQQVQIQQTYSFNLEIMTHSY